MKMPACLSDGDDHSTPAERRFARAQQRTADRAELQAAVDACANYKSMDDRSVLGALVGAVCIQDEEPIFGLLTEIEVLLNQVCDRVVEDHNLHPLAYLAYRKAQAAQRLYRLRGLLVDSDLREKIAAQDRADAAEVGEPQPRTALSFLDESIGTAIERSAEISKAATDLFYLLVRMDGFTVRGDETVAKLQAQGKESLATIIRHCGDLDSIATEMRAKSGLDAKLEAELAEEPSDLAAAAEE